MKRVGQVLAWGVIIMMSGCADQPVSAGPVAGPDPTGPVTPSPETVADNPGVRNVEDDALTGPVSVAVVEAGTEPRRPVELVGADSSWTVSLVTTVHEPVETQPRAVPLRLVVLLGPRQQDADEVSWRVGTVELLGLSGEKATLDRGLRNGLRKLAKLSGSLSVSTGEVRFEHPKLGEDDHWVVQGTVRTVRHDLRWAAGHAVEEPLGLGARWDADVAGPTNEDEPVGGAHYTVVAGIEEGTFGVRIVPWLAGRDTVTAMQLTEGVLSSPSDRFQLQGSAVQGGIVVGTTLAGTEAYLHGRRLAVSEQGEFFVPFGRNTRSAHLVLRFPDGTRSEHVFQVEERQYETEAIDGLPDEMVNPGREVLAELRQVNRRIDRVRQTVSQRPVSLGEFRWPATGRVTSTYGRERILNGVPKGYHWGVDIAAPVGRTVRAPASGVVVFAEKDVPLSGNIVILDHGLGLTSSFLHLDRIRVKVGDEVARGDVIGKVGATGRATGPHLDWRMNVMGTRVDPALLVEGEP